MCWKTADMDFLQKVKLKAARRFQFKSNYKVPNVYNAIMATARPYKSCRPAAAEMC